MTATNGPTPRTDDQEARYRAEWLHKHNAPKGWLVLTEFEVATIKHELTDVQRELAAIVLANLTRDTAISEKRIVHTADQRQRGLVKLWFAAKELRVAEHWRT